jgi:hypothetical protein
MIETSRSATLAATVLHRVTGTIDQQQAEQGAAEALRFVQRLSSEVGPVNLVLDLRGNHFQDLQAHKVWSQGFARNPPCRVMCSTSLFLAMIRQPFALSRS